MLINWFTVLAQIVNFLVLVALLKHFLWGKLVRAIDQREARIAGELAAAEQKLGAAEQQMQQARAAALEQEEKCGEIIFQARKDADEQRAKMISKSRETVREMEAQWHEDLERERATFVKELRKRAATEILGIARQALADLASSDLQRSAVDVFLEKLRSLDAATLRSMAGGELVVRSPAELPADIQEEIRTVLAEHIGPRAPLQFQRDPAMAWGIELRGNGLKLGWSPESYLDSIEETLKAELDRAKISASEVASG